MQKKIKKIRKSRESVHAPVDVHHPRSDLAGGESLQGVQPLQDALHVVLQSGQRHHNLLVQASSAGSRRSTPAPVPISSALHGHLKSSAETRRLRACREEDEKLKWETNSWLRHVPGFQTAGFACGYLNNDTTTAKYFMPSWEMWYFNLLCSELESVFSAAHCLRVQQVAAPTSSSSGRRAVPHVCVWPLPLGHRPAVFAIFPSTPDHLRWAINLHLLHLPNRWLALPFLQVVQGVVTIWDLEKWCKNQSKILQPQDRGGSLGAFSCLVLSQLVNRVAVDLAVRVAGQVAGARHVCSEYRGQKK